MVAQILMPCGCCSSFLIWERAVFLRKLFEIRDRSNIQCAYQNSPLRYALITRQWILRPSSTLTGNVWSISCCSKLVCVFGNVDWYSCSHMTPKRRLFMCVWLFRGRISVCLLELTVQTSSIKLYRKVTCRVFSMITDECSVSTWILPCYAEQSFATW